jgi:hypothetical protein
MANLEFKFRSVSSIVIAPAKTGNESNNKTAVISTAHANNGIRSRIIPKARKFPKVKIISKIKILFEDISSHLIYLGKFGSLGMLKNILHLKLN